MNNSLQNLATKQELQEVKAELLQKLASKEELVEVKEDVSGLKENFVSLEQKVDRNSENIIKLTMHYINIKENMVTKTEFEQKHNRVLNILDQIVKRLDIMCTEMKAQDLRFNRTMDRIDNEHARNDKQDRILNNHEERIDELETNLVH